MARLNVPTSIRLTCMVFVAFTLTAMLVGCDDESGAPEPDYSEGLVGPDQDGNGVRDDVDAYIEENYSGQMRDALFQFAEAQTEFLLAADDPEEALSVAEERSRAQYCAFSVDGSEGLAAVSEVKAEVLSTEERTDAHIRADSHLSGEVFIAPNTDEDLSSYCE